jgi:hypothetical protein
MVTVRNLMVDVLAESAEFQKMRGPEFPPPTVLYSEYIIIIPTYTGTAPLLRGRRYPKLATILL